MKERYLFLIKSFVYSVAFVGAASTSFGQQSPAINLKDSLIRFANRDKAEKIYMHVDRPLYVAGEIVWYKLYVLDGNFYKPSELSKVAYVELLDRDNVPVIQEFISIDHGNGNGAIQLPASLGSGNYRIRAYTNWMKNFGPECFFEHTFSIVNLFEGSSLGDTSVSPVFDIQFFPEGGNFVRGLRSKTGVKVTDGQGKGRTFRGWIVADAGDTVVRFNSLKFGMGSFLFTPQNRGYKAFLEINDKMYPAHLPKINDEGIVVDLNEEQDHKLRITALSNRSDVPFLSLLIHGRTESTIAESLTFINGKAELLIDDARLAAGVSVFTFFDDRQRPVAERIYFKRPQNSLNITTSAGRSIFKLRDSVLVNIKVRTDSNNLAKARLSLAVYKFDSLSKSPQSDMLSYVWLSSELKGYVESPGYYFESDESEIRRAADNLMLTQGWRSFDWVKMLGEETGIKYLPEYEGHIIDFKLKGLETMGNFIQAGAILSKPGKNFSVFTSRLKNNGTLRFVTKSVYGPSDLLLQFTSGAYDPRNLVMENPYMAVPTLGFVPELNIPKTWTADLTDRGVSVQVQNIYSKEQINKFVRSDKTQTPFYGLPDKTYKLDDYTRFPTIIEVMTEYIPEVAIRKQQDKHLFKILSDARKGFLDNEPLILVDGISVTSTKMLTIDPLKIDKLQVVSDKFTSGGNSFFGIVSYTGYDNEYGWIQSDIEALKIRYNGMKEQRVFYSPLYKSKTQIENSHPDFRTLLYWSSDIILNDSSLVRFYTSDIPGKYIGVLQGITSSGEMGTGSFIIEVR